MKSKGKKKLKKPKAPTLANNGVVPMEEDGKKTAPAVWRPGQDPIEVRRLPYYSMKTTIFIFKSGMQNNLANCHTLACNGVSKPMNPSMKLGISDTSCFVMLYCQCYSRSSADSCIRHPGQRKLFSQLSILEGW